MTSQGSKSEQPELPNPLSESYSHAYQNALVAEARQKLVEDVIEFLLRMKKGGEKELGRNPFSEDLIPYFQQYAWRVIDVRYKEQIVTAPSLAEARERIRASIDQVLMEICQRREIVNGKAEAAGVWFETVEEACQAVDLGSWITAFGTYDRAAFSRAKQTQLRALLLVQARELEKEFWSRRAKEPQQIANAIVPFPKRARWFKDSLEERKWNYSTLESRRGPNRTTSRHISKGIGVSEGTLEKLAKALSRFLDRNS